MNLAESILAGYGLTREQVAAMLGRPVEPMPASSLRPVDAKWQPVPADLRALVRQKYAAGDRPCDIARAAGLPPSTVRHILSKG
jgi:DNA-directed RNA polymerase specialized sigma24 family protein